MTNFEPGQRVTVLTYDGRLIGNGTVSVSRTHGHPSMSWVRLTIAGETFTQEYANSQLRSRS